MCIQTWTNRITARGFPSPEQRLPIYPGLQDKDGDATEEVRPGGHTCSGQGPRSVSSSLSLFLFFPSFVVC